MEGNIEGTRRPGRRLKHILGDIKEERKYWNVKEGSTALCGEFALGRGGAKDLWLDYRMLCGFGTATFGQSFCNV